MQNDMAGIKREVNKTRKNLQEARKAKGMTQQAIAKYLNITVQHYQRIESGKIIGKVETWDKLEDLFNTHQRILRENHPDKGVRQEIHQE